MRIAEGFKPDNRIGRMLSAVFDYIVLSLLTVICAAPVVSAGAALTALHYVLLHRMRGDETDAVRSFFRAWKENFWQATELWLILAGLATAWVLVVRRMGEGGNVFAWGGIVLAAALLAGTAVYVFPLQARYANSVFGTMRLALQIAMASLPRAAAMVILIGGFGFLLYNAPARFAPLFLVFGTAPVHGLCARLYVPVLMELEEKRKEQ